MARGTPARYARLRALIKNPEYLLDLELVQKGLTPSDIKNRDGQPIQAEDLERVDLASARKGFSHRAISWLLDKYKLSFPITPELFKSKTRSEWNKIAVFADDVYQVVEKRRTPKANTRKTYGEKAVLKSKPKCGVKGIGPIVPTADQKEKLWIDLDKKYERRFRDQEGNLKTDAPHKDLWKAEEYKKRTGQRWNDPNAPSAIAGADLIDITKQTGFEIGERNRAKMVDAINIYLSTKEVLNGLPRPAQVAAALAQLKELAGSFDRTLKELDFVSRSTLYVQCDRIDIEKARRQARMIGEGCSTALKSLPFDKGGRPEEIAIKLFIKEMAKVFKDATQKAPTLTWNPYSERYGGKFFGFIELCLKRVDPKAIGSNSSLGQKIKTAVRKEKIRK
jgi:hypothetical protein